ncbi:PARD3 [Acanthosepion pharaonis]|uniref:PARD3 n=1 Tax=Acanthosepion pharaonis TaxID=158019 RepID=A0A812D5S7_ACAPH|nr:PARD3 [Sepia pharaonis]
MATTRRLAFLPAQRAIYTFISSLPFWIFLTGNISTSKRSNHSPFVHLQLLEDVIVPCGDGDLLVKELIDKAIIRYKKAVGKSNDSWVTVQSLKTCSDGGILDPDDHLNDVVDDREQLTAIYEEQPANHLHNNGDGASASSVGTSSPDIFQSNNGPSGASNGDFKSSNLSDNDVIVTLDDVPSGPGLTVRRGSEPALVGLGEEETSSGLAVKPETPVVHKRWATFGNDTEFKTSTSKQAQDGREEPVGGSIEKETNSNVAEKELEIIVTLKNDGEPLGIHVVPDYDEDDKETGLLLQRIEPGSKISRDGRLKTEDRIIEINGSNLMGISFDRAQEIFRKAMKTNEIQLKVLKSNPPPLPKMPPPLLPKPTARNRTSPPKPSPLTLPPTNPDEPKDQVDNSKNLNNQKNAYDDDDDISSSISSGKSESNAASDEKPSSGSSVTENSGMIDDNSVPPSPTKKVPPAVPTRHPTTALSTKDRNMFSASTNTRKIGKKLAIQLKKGSNGLGFSITSRDNPTGGSVPIYIKNILSKGAAVEDGKLRPGDRLLEVNGIEMSGKTQEEAVTILRNTKLGAIVNLLISRQSTDQPPPKPARDNLEKKSSSRPSSTSPAILVDHGEISPTPDASNQEYLTFDIALNETSSAGLGVSVKGNTNPSETGANRDLGIFVKAIINGGAASKDGRLNVNDQLIEINGDSLLGLTNHDAMETLRQAMRNIDTVNSHIRLVIARHQECTDSPLPSLNSVSISNHNSSCSDETESIENGQNDGNAIHNTSIGCQTASDSKSKNIGIQSLTVNPPEQETVLIEDDSYEQDDGYPPVFSGDDYSPNSPNLWNEETMLNHENSELNPLSPDFDPNLAFQREGFGRQSMSEKRRGHHDARYSDFYHLAKNNRDDRAGKQGLIRAGSMESLIGNKVNSGTKLHDDMSARGLHSDMSLRKRSSSMESLPTPDSAFENQAPPFWAAERVARGRMCNESFRAAVDRSYNAPHIIQNMETLEEENSDTGSGPGHGQLPPRVHRPVAHKDNSIPQDVQAQPPQPVTKATKKKERDNRKSGGLFKGIFKFGKSNKEDKAAANKDQTAEKENSGKQKNDKPLPEILEMDRNWKNPRADPERLPEHPKSPYLASRAPVPRQRPGYRDPYYTEPYVVSTTTRTDKIQQLREEHQRRHQERQGRYPLDEQEEMYERHLQEMERRKFSNQNQHPPPPPPPQPPYPEAEYAIVNKIHHPGGRPNPHERMNAHLNYQEKSHIPPYVPPTTHNQMEMNVFTLQIIQVNLIQSILPLTQQDPEKVGMAMVVEISHHVNNHVITGIIPIINHRTILKVAMNHGFTFGLGDTVPLLPGPIQYKWSLQLLQEICMIIIQMVDMTMQIPLMLLSPVVEGHQTLQLMFEFFSLDLS